jgi:hypothetical protein
MRRGRAPGSSAPSRYGAKGFAYAWEGEWAMITFRLHDHHFRFVLPLPDRHDRSFTHTPHGSEAHGAVRHRGVRASGTAALAPSGPGDQGEDRGGWTQEVAVRGRARGAAQAGGDRVPASAVGSTGRRLGLVLIPLSHSFAVAGHRYETGMPLVCGTRSQGARTDVDNPF